MTDEHHYTIDLRKVEPSSYHIRLQFRELWRAWRRGIYLPKARVDALYPITVGAGGGDWYAGEWTVPKDVTSVNIEVYAGGRGDSGYNPVSSLSHLGFDNKVHAGSRAICETCYVERKQNE